MDKAQVERMAAMSGEGQGKPFKYNIPMIKFHGVKGEFKKVVFGKTKDEKEESPVGNSVEIVILKKRKLLSSFSPTASYFTTEYESPNQEVALFKNVAGTVTFEKSAKPGDLRTEFQALRTKEVLYVLWNGEVAKLEIKGGSLTAFYDYLKSLSDKDVHSFMVKTVIGVESTKNESGFAYERMTFKDAPLSVSLDEIEKAQQEVVNNLKKVDASFAANKVAITEASEKSAADKEFDELTADEPNPDDIPF